MAGSVTVRELVTRWRLNADTKQIAAFQKGIEGAKKAVNIATTAILAMGVASVKFSADFEKAFAEVLTLVDLNAEQTEALRKQILQLSKDTGQLPVDVAKAFYATISGGFSDVASSSEVMRASLDLAKGGVTETENATKGLVSILNAYGYSAADSTSVSDALFVAMRAGQTTIGELASSLGAVSPVAANAGVSLEEVLAAVAALTKGGISTKVAVTGLRAVMAAVLKPSEEAVKVSEELGIQFNAAALEAMGLADFLQMVGKAAKGDNEKLAKLFGGVEALVPIMSLVNKQSGDFASILDQMGDRAGATAAAVAKMENTTSDRFNKMKARFAVLAIDVGAKLLPVVNRLMEALSKVAETFADNEAAVDALVGAFKILLAMKLITYFKNLATAMAAVAKLAGAGGAGAGAAAAGAGGAAAGGAGAAAARGIGLIGRGTIASTLLLQGDSDVEARVAQARIEGERERTEAFQQWLNSPVSAEDSEINARWAKKTLPAIAEAARGMWASFLSEPTGGRKAGPRNQRIGFTPDEISELLAIGTGKGAPTLSAIELARLGGAGQLAPKNIQITSNVTVEVPFGTTAEQAERIASYVRPVFEKELESAARKVAADGETK